MVTQPGLRSLRSSPLFVPLAAALGLIFLSLVSSSTSTKWFAQAGYLLGSTIVAAVAWQTWLSFDKPNNWAAAGGLLGLVAAAVFAATELAIVEDNEVGGGAVLIPVSWLFAATGWFAHFMRVKTLRWVITLVQVSFVLLSAFLFFILAARSLSATGNVGYRAAAVIGTLGGAMSITGIFGRIKSELAKRNA